MLKSFAVKTLTGWPFLSLTTAVSDDHCVLTVMCAHYSGAGCFRLAERTAVSGTERRSAEKSVACSEPQAQGRLHAAHRIAAAAIRKSELLITVL